MMSMTGFGRAVRDAGGRRRGGRDPLGQPSGARRQGAQPGPHGGLRSRDHPRGAGRPRAGVGAGFGRGRRRTTDPPVLRRAGALGSPDLEKLRQELGLSEPVDLATVATFLRLEREPATPRLELDATSSRAWRRRWSALQEMRARGEACCCPGSPRSGRTAGPCGRRPTPAAPSPWPNVAPRGCAIGCRRSAAGPGGGPCPPRPGDGDAGRPAGRQRGAGPPGRAPGPAATSCWGGPARRKALGERSNFWYRSWRARLNTLGVKAQDVEVSALVIEGKAELEKIREQAQNIE